MKTRANRLAAMITVFVMTLMAACPMLAFAAESETTAAQVETAQVEAAAEEASGGISAILPDMAEFIPMLIAFIILWIILAKFGWPVFNGMLEKRENTIREALKRSEEAQVESERVLAEYQKQLSEAKAQSSQIIAEARTAGDAIKEDMTSKAQQEAADILAKARESIEAERKQVMVQLQSSVADTAVDLATRLVGEGLNENEHRKIIERYVDEAGSFNAN